MVVLSNPSLSILDLYSFFMGISADNYQHVETAHIEPTQML